MPNSTVETLTDISTASGLQSTDLFYVFRSGSPDADYRADGADIVALVESASTAFQDQHARLDDIAANLSATSGAIEKTGANTFGTFTVTSAAKSLLDDSDAAAMRTTLGLAIGTNVQAYDAELAAIAGLTSAADRVPYFTGSGTAALATVTSFARTVLDDADAATARATLGAGTGDVAGPGSSTDNTLPRFDGTGGKTIQTSGVSVSDNNEISGFRTLLNDQTGTTYTLQSTDTGKTVTLTNSSAITVTLPNSLSVGFTCEFIQKGTGQVTFLAGSGATLQHRQTHTKIAGQHGAARVTVTANSGGSAAVYNLAGDTGA